MAFGVGSGDNAFALVETLTTASIEGGALAAGLAAGGAECLRAASLAASGRAGGGGGGGSLAPAAPGVDDAPAFGVGVGGVAAAWAALVLPPAGVPPGCPGGASWAARAGSLAAASGVWLSAVAAAARARASSSEAPDGLSVLSVLSVRSVRSVLSLRLRLVVPPLREEAYKDSPVLLFQNQTRPVAGST